MRDEKKAMFMLLSQSNAVLGREGEEGVFVTTSNLTTCNFGKKRKNNGKTTLKLKKNV